MTSRPARRNYKTGRAAQPTAPASGAAQWRTRCRPTPTRHRHITYRGRRHDAGLGAGRCAGAVLEHAASGATERGRRCSERSSLRAPAPRPRAPRAPRRALARTKTTNLSSVPAGPPTRGRCPGCLLTRNYFCDFALIGITRRQVEKYSKKVIFL